MKRMEYRKLQTDKSQRKGGKAAFRSVYGRTTKVYIGPSFTKKFLNPITCRRERKE